MQEQYTMNSSCIRRNATRSSLTIDDRLRYAATRFKFVRDVSASQWNSYPTIQCARLDDDQSCFDVA